MALKTRLTERLGIEHPVLSAPMAFVAGGRLAAAVTEAGGLGIVGAGYGDPPWMEEQFRAAGNARFGCGFITWSLAQTPQLLDLALEREPAAIFLSFGDPRPFRSKLAGAGVPLICQVQTVADAKVAIDAGAGIIVAQGAEAGGHAEKRATLPLVPEIADLLAARAPDALLCAAGGIADGRGLAAALMLGADGVLVGSRFSATDEALVFKGWHERLLQASGDDTVPTSTVDIARKRDWPERFAIRVLRNALTERWSGREHEMRQAQEREGDAYAKAVEAGDTDNYGVIVGEAVGLIHAIEPAGAVLRRMVAEAEALLAKGPAFVHG